MRSIEVTKAGNVLDEKGEVQFPGWSRKQVLTYHRDQIKAPIERIKEWDYYCVLNEHYAVCLTVADNGYMGLISVSILDFDANWQHTEGYRINAPMGSLKMPATSDSGDVFFENDEISITFIKEENKRLLQCSMRAFKDGKPFSCEIELLQPEMDRMVISTPWQENKTAFYYNEKINCMPASGSATFDGRDYVFDSENDYGTLDWGRGVWTYDNTWYWGSGNMTLNGKPFGFNIGYGFGDTSAATENIIYYNNVGHKIDDIVYEFDDQNFMAPWKITSSDQRFEMTFTPTLDRFAYTKLPVPMDFETLISDAHQVFGKMSGYVVLDDGTKLTIQDMVCFHEKVRQRY